MAAGVLITGSRTWVNATMIRDALLSVWGDGDAVLFSGACPRGADRIAEMFWTRWGGRVERHSADWATYRRVAGFRRNAEMVIRGADVCLGFIRDGSHRRFTQWTQAGLWRRLHQVVLDELGTRGLIDWSRAVLDGASVRTKKGAY